MAPNVNRSSVANEGSIFRIRSRSGTDIQATSALAATRGLWFFGRGKYIQYNLRHRWARYTAAI